MKILITGGAGFIGSALVRQIMSTTEHVVCNIDSLTYAGSLETLHKVAHSPRYKFIQADITKIKILEKIFRDFMPDAVVHLAAETHVDRSVSDPEIFISTNIIGTYNLLEVSRAYWSTLHPVQKENFRFQHISTDEVYGSLGNEGVFVESSRYNPSSPYSASKASSDHLVRAWNKTYGLPTLITNCSNNFGPFQFPEKLIPLIISKAISLNPLPIYGDGQQVRDWLFVEDHARALMQILHLGKIGETYNIGAQNERTNLEVVEEICSILDCTCSQQLAEGGSYRDLISFVPDRPGHDHRYAIDPSKIQNEIGWYPQETFETGLRKTVEWYLHNLDWTLTENKS